MIHFSQSVYLADWGANTNANAANTSWSPQNIKKARKGSSNHIDTLH